MLEKVINTLKNSTRYKERLTHVEILPIKDPIYGNLKKELPQKIKDYLSKKKIKLYIHQCEAIESLRDGKNIIITTPTASGKTLAFNIPIFEKLEQDKKATALYIYPTKALSNDQLKVVKEFEAITGINVNPSIYDGDTPTSKRPKIRESSRIIISNPYEMHQVLPWHYKWQRFFSNLKFVVIDEAHRYRGVFGSNLAFLIRRFRRILDLYGSAPQFIISTATLANPIEFSERLIGVKFSLINNDGAPKGRKYFIFINPYFDGVGTLSTHQETKDLFLFFVTNNLKTLCFTISRKMAEIITLWSKKALKKSKGYMDKITAYRAGYTPKERRVIENNLKKGRLKGVVSTNALELGIDVGSLDCVIISGYPGTIISTWQQAGRAGRGVNESIAALVAFQNPLDQYFMMHPKVFFEKPHEHAIIDLSNPYILSGHLICASSELPIKLPNDMKYFGDNVEDLLKALMREEVIRDTVNGWVYSGKGRATEAVSLNNISSEIFKVICDGELIETMDKTQAFREAHKRAVLVHQGETYIVEDLDLKNRLVHVKRRDVDYYTEAMKSVDIKVLKEVYKKEIGNFFVYFGEMEVNEQYIGYRIMRYDKVLGIEDLDLPPLIFKTMGLWFNVPAGVKRKIEEKKLDFAGGLHGIEHAMIGIMPFHVMCDRWDIGGVSTSLHPDTMTPTIFIYDGFEGGIGLTEKAFELFSEIVEMTFELVRDCKCEDGCPACIYSPKCGNNNKPMDKKATILILNELLKLIGLNKKSF